MAPETLCSSQSQSLRPLRCPFPSSIRLSPNRGSQSISPCYRYFKLRADDIQREDSYPIPYGIPVEYRWHLYQGMSIIATSKYTHSVTARLTGIPLRSSNTLLLHFEQFRPDMHVHFAGTKASSLQTLAIPL